MKTIIAMTLLAASAMAQPTLPIIMLGDVVTEPKANVTECQGCGVEEPVVNGFIIDYADDGKTFLWDTDEGEGPSWSAEMVGGATVFVQLTSAVGTATSGECEEKEQFPGGVWECQKKTACNFYMVLYLRAAFVDDPGLPASAPPMTMPGGTTAQPGAIRHLGGNTYVVSYTATFSIDVNCNDQHTMDLKLGSLPSVLGYPALEGDDTWSIDLPCARCEYQ